MSQSDSRASAISYRRAVYFFGGFEDFQDLGFSAREDCIVSHKEGRRRRRGGHRPYVCVDATKLERGKCHDLISTGLLRPYTLDQERKKIMWLLKKAICALLHWCSGAMGPVRQGSIVTEHYNHLPLYSIHSRPTLRRTLVVNLIYWFAQSVPTFSGSTTQPSPIPHVLYSAKPRPYLGLHPCGAVHNS